MPSSPIMSSLQQRGDDLSTVYETDFARTTPTMDSVSYGSSEESVISNISTIASKLSVTSLDADDDPFPILSRLIDAGCGWMDDDPPRPTCSMNPRDKDKKGSEESNKPSLLVHSKGTPYSSQLYKNRRRGILHKSNRYLSRFADKMNVDVPAGVNPHTAQPADTAAAAEEEVQTLEQEPIPDAQPLGLKGRIKSMVRRKPTSGEAVPKIDKKRDHRKSDRSKGRKSGGSTKSGGGSTKKPRRVSKELFVVKMAK